ncbi:MAG TPA: Gfo/Idh/MocA family oxidoreductase [Deinococcales bacterium]|nr:Gfo/Idh/MocA family oxidoreductase [Deinococcales bacterium]
MPETRVGVIGCGNIAPIYLKAPRSFPSLRVVACADVVIERARARAEEFGVPRACTPEELLAAPDVDVVVNLTIPAAHADIARQALEAGKHAYNEKPAAVKLEDGQALLALAKQKGLRFGGAPDTFLGAGLQTCRALIDAGAIGEPVAATAFMLSHGPEAWHPDPHFFFQPGAGPLFDMGPYYLTAMVNLLGPVARTTSFARASFAERVVGSGPKAGEKIPVNTPTHITAALEFAAGPTATLVTSFDVWHGEVPRIEIYGSEGTLSVPDPNTFGGPVRIRRAGQAAWEEVPVTRPFSENSRGIGVAEMGFAIRAGRPARASGDLTVHVLEVMHGILSAASTSSVVTIESRPARPAALPEGDDESILH